MWGKIKIAIYTAMLFMAGWAGFVWGMLFYKNKLDKEETKTYFEVRNLKANKGGYINIPLEGESGKFPAQNASIKELKPKKRFKLFKKRKND